MCAYKLQLCNKLSSNRASAYIAVVVVAVCNAVTKAVACCANSRWYLYVVTSCFVCALISCCCAWLLLPLLLLLLLLLLYIYLVYTAQWRLMCLFARILSLCCCFQVVVVASCCSSGGGDDDDDYDTQIANLWCIGTLQTVRSSRHCSVVLWDRRVLNLLFKFKVKL